MAATLEGEDGLLFPSLSYQELELNSPVGIENDAVYPYESGS